MDARPVDEPGAAIVVVAAVIEREGRFLLTRRLPGTHLSGLWEFPGGKIAPGETHRDGLRREIREELGSELEVFELVHETTHAYPERTVTLYFYRCALEGTPQPQIGQQMRWVSREELTSVGLPPADEELIRLLAAPA